MEKSFNSFSGFMVELFEFVAAYGLQVFGALVGLYIVLQIAAWTGNKTTQFAEAKYIETTRARFLGHTVKIIFICFVAIIILDNFGVSIASLLDW